MALWGISHEEIFENMLRLRRFGVYIERNNYSLFALIYASCSDAYMLVLLEKILKIWCSLVRFGVYFDQIVS